MLLRMGFVIDPHCSTTRVFPLIWKLENPILTHEKRYKQNLEKYHSLISPNQSGFKPGASCIDQLSSITQVHKSFDYRYKVCRIFFDISKAFDEVWRKDLISELLQNGT